jgi:hypothetical protein
MILASRKKWGNNAGLRRLFGLLQTQGQAHRRFSIQHVRHQGVDAYGIVNDKPMNSGPSYHAVLFKSVNQTMWAEKILKEKKLPHKLIPVPRQVSSDCGVCIRIESALIEAVKRELAGIDGFTDIVRI